MNRPPSFNADAVNPLVPGLLTGYGDPARGVLVSKPSARGIAKVRVRRACLRCGGGGGSDRWIATGWKCFDCQGTGEGTAGLASAYTPEAYAKLEARRAKLAAKREAARLAAEAERRAPYLAWAEQHAHVLGQIKALAPANLVERIEADGAAFKISPDWILDVAVVAILREGMRADIKAASEHVGEVGKRVEMKLTCEKVLDYSERGSNGYLIRAFYIALMRDEHGNRVVYKGGTLPLGEGYEGRFKVTIKEHGERDGEKQTVIQRAKAIEEAA